METLTISSTDTKAIFKAQQRTALRLKKSGVEERTARLQKMKQVITEYAERIVKALHDDFKKPVEEANEMGEPLDEVSEEELEAQQELEDDLVEKAIAGDDSEDAQAALLGYNPNFRQYVQPQMPTNNNWYGSDGIYTDQQNYDNPSSRFFSGASDETHQKMVRQQYERK